MGWIIGHAIGGAGEPAPLLLELLERPARTARKHSTARWRDEHTVAGSARPYQRIDIGKNDRPPEAGGRWPNSTIWRWLSVSRTALS